MQALGRLFDIGTLCVPTDAVAGAITGARLDMRNCGGVTIVLVAAAGSTDILDIDLQEHTAASGGTSRDLDVITEYWLKGEATLDNDETWTRVTQAAASEVTDIGAASEQQLVVFEVESSSLSSDCRWLSVNIPDAGANGTKFVAGLYITRDLKIQLDPTRMASMLGA